MTLEDLSRLETMHAEVHPAAPAEIYQWFPEMAKALREAWGERDEARAEVERLKTLARLTRGTVVGPITATPMPVPQPLVIATAASLDALRAEVAALKQELENLRVVVATLRAESEETGPHPYRITACPSCCSSALYYSKRGSFDSQAKCQITCRDCNWKRYD